MSDLNDQNNINTLSDVFSEMSIHPEQLQQPIQDIDFLVDRTIQLEFELRSLREELIRVNRLLYRYVMNEADFDEQWFTEEDDTYPRSCCENSMVAEIERLGERLYNHMDNIHRMKN